MSGAILALAGLLFSSAAASAGPAEPQLYPTGPDQDITLLRVVNADAKNRLGFGITGGASASLAPDAPVGPYRSVAPDAQVQIESPAGRRAKPIPLQLHAGGQASLVVSRETESGPWTSQLFAEAPTPFDPLRASLAFYNASPACKQASLIATPKNTLIFDQQAPGSIARRGINAVKLSVSARCNEQAVAGTLDLGDLQAGQGYSVFLVPGQTGPRLIGSRDRVAY